jgi:hypothetical protein
MKSPFAVIVREGVNDDNVMGQLATASEVSVQHDSGSRAPGFLTGSSAARNVEALDNHVMGRLQQDHPVWIWRWLVNRHVPGLSHGLEMDVSLVICAGPFAQDEASVPARHDSHQVAALGHVRGVLEATKNRVNGILLRAASVVFASRVQVECADAYSLGWVFRSIHQEHPRIRLLHVQGVSHPLIGVLGLVEDWRGWCLSEEAL